MDTELKNICMFRKGEGGREGGGLDTELKAEHSHVPEGGGWDGGGGGVVVAGNCAEDKQHTLGEILNT